jgi:hypothetical protein
MEAPNKQKNPSTLFHQDISTSEGTIVVDKKGLQYSIDDNPLEDNSKSIFHNGEPVITTGYWYDVSRFVVDIRDDEDLALIFRSMFLGTIFAGMGAALSQVSNSKILNNDSNNAVRFN